MLRLEMLVGLALNAATVLLARGGAAVVTAGPAATPAAAAAAASSLGRIGVVKLGNEGAGGAVRVPSVVNNW